MLGMTTLAAKPALGATTTVAACLGGPPPRFTRLVLTPSQGITLQSSDDSVHAVFWNPGGATITAECSNGDTLSDADISFAVPDSPNPPPANYWVSFDGGFTWTPSQAAPNVPGSPHKVVTPADGTVKFWVAGRSTGTVPLNCQYEPETDPGDPNEAAESCPFLGGTVARNIEAIVLNVGGVDVDVVEASGPVDASETNNTAPPPTDPTPELDSIVLFGAGALLLGGLYVKRQRSARKAA